MLSNGVAIITIMLWNFSYYLLSSSLILVIFKDQGSHFKDQGSPEKLQGSP